MENLSKIFVIGAVLLSFLPISSFAQTPCGEWNIERTEWYACPDTSTRTWDTEFIIHTALMATTTVMDIESTQSGISQGGRELNPLFGSNPSSARLYGTLIPIGIGVGWLSYELKKRNVKWWRVPMVTWSVAHGFAATLNLLEFEFWTR